MGHKKAIWFFVQQNMGSAQDRQLWIMFIHMFFFLAGQGEFENVWFDTPLHVLGFLNHIPSLYAILAPTLFSLTSKKDIGKPWPRWMVIVRVVRFEENIWVGF